MFSRPHETGRAPTAARPTRRPKPAAGTGKQCCCISIAKSTGCANTKLTFRSREAPNMQSETKKLRDTAVAAVIALLAERYPKCFSVYEGRRRPLKLGIHNARRGCGDEAVPPTPSRAGTKTGVTN